MNPLTELLPVAELCYVCTLPIMHGQPVLVLKDDDDITWYVHQHCQDGLRLITEMSANTSK